MAIVDRGFVDQVLQGRNAVGQQVRFRYPGPSSRRWGPGNPDDPAGPGDWHDVIGVVRELGVGAPRQPGRAAGFYLPATPDQFDQIHVMVHVRGGDPMKMGVRVALGASRHRIVAATFRRPLFQVALGVAVGTAIIFTVAR